MTITTEEAREARARLREAGTPAAAAHQCGVELRAIAPFTSRTLSKVQRVLRALDTLTTINPEKAGRWIADLDAIADREVSA